MTSEGIGNWPECFLRGDDSTSADDEIREVNEDDEIEEILNEPLPEGEYANDSTLYKGSKLGRLVGVIATMGFSSQTTPLYCPSCARHFRAALSSLSLLAPSQSPHPRWFWRICFSIMEHWSTVQLNSCVFMYGFVYCLWRFVESLVSTRVSEVIRGVREKMASEAFWS
ncbi:hypothetical protein V8G54_032035 [Vigna mungo]|uniref:Uncharacterized protein n=1 Tax=Vigna mungo TaxID=3915 RepID=A0AAQ3MKU4_VIGMU